MRITMISIALAALLGCAHTPERKPERPHIRFNALLLTEQRPKPEPKQSADPFRRYNEPTRKPAAEEEAAAAAIGHLQNGRLADAVRSARLAGTHAAGQPGSAALARLTSLETAYAAWLDHHGCEVGQSALIRGGRAHIATCEGQLSLLHHSPTHARIARLVKATNASIAGDSISDDFDPMDDGRGDDSIFDAGLYIQRAAFRDVTGDGVPELLLGGMAYEGAGQTTYFAIRQWRSGVLWRDVFRGTGCWQYDEAGGPECADDAERFDVEDQDDGPSIIHTHNGAHSWYPDARIFSRSPEVLMAIAAKWMGRKLTHLAADAMQQARLIAPNDLAVIAQAHEVDDAAKRDRAENEKRVAKATIENAQRQAKREAERQAKAKAKRKAQRIRDWDEAARLGLARRAFYMGQPVKEAKRNCRASRVAPQLLEGESPMICGDYWMAHKRGRVTGLTHILDARGYTMLDASTRGTFGRPTWDYTYQVNGRTVEAHVWEISNRRYVTMRKAPWGSMWMWTITTHLPREEKRALRKVERNQ